jgi:hypothetical protein
MSDRPSQSWATPAIRSQPAEALRTFENGLAVHLIETHREDFISCAADDPLAEVVENSRSRQFDFLPVTEPTAVGVGSARIIGLIHLVPFLAEDAAPEGSVGRYMQPLSEQNLIGADASILEFVRDADRRSLRFVVAGREISGLVSLSDLQRLPTRASLFALVTYLEMTMTEVIRCHIGDADPLERLPPDRRKKVYEKIAKAKRSDAFVDALLFTEFADKVTLIKRCVLQSGKNQFEKDSGKIRDLRDGLAHANDYASTADKARLVCKTVRLVDHWIERLTFGAP